jgi:hypothetical protein
MGANLKANKLRHLMALTRLARFEMKMRKMSGVQEVES